MVWLQYLAQSIIGSCEELGVPCNEGDSGGLRTILSIVFIVLGAASALFIIIGGIRYAASGGDPNNAKQARDTILYAIIGLVVSLSALGIVTFVLGRI